MNYLQQWSEAFKEGLGNLSQRLTAYLPTILGVLALIAVGWILASLLRGLVRRLSDRFEWLRNRVIERPLRRLGIERPASEVVGSLVFWAVWLLFITAATEMLGLPVVASWLAGLSYYLPRVLLGLLIVAAGLLTGSLLGDAVQRAASSAGVAQAALLGQTTQLAILLIAVVTAVEQVGIGTRFLTATLVIVVAAVIGGAALAFALGARSHVRDLIAAHYLRQVYREGQLVRVGGVQGKIAEILPTAAILETSDGRALVPAREFSEAVSVRLTPEA